ncbi:hypothetical protein UFOVP93_9 [uncultured Caudovirales phage]|uniref:Uncharacterized protein n=1 Tax=uncultured Caudovirales phage TaxID=2100421 RepID=A0A6J5KZY5_9CAUD|nr:hypothetical protein UFOVP93_9 [uncultured Caudovirales phage]
MEENQVTENVVDNPIIGPEEEKMIPQSQVDKIIKHKTYQAAKIHRELEEKHQRELEAIQAQQQKQTQHNENVPRDVDANAIYQQVQERFNQEMQQRQIKTEMDRIANSYLSKMEQGKTDYDDFEEITKEFDPTAFPQLTYLVAGMDNAADVIYDLSRNPLKLAGLDRLAEKNPRQAQSELLKLSRSIAENRQAKTDENSQNVAAPLDRLQPSRVSGSNGKMGIRDLRNQPWLKG